MQRAARTHPTRPTLWHSPHNRRLTHQARVWCRKFITTHYKALKAANPELPVLLRECAGTEARLTARFGASLRRAAAPLRVHSLCRCCRLTRAAHPPQTKAARLASP